MTDKWLEQYSERFNLVGSNFFATSSNTLRRVRAQARLHGHPFPLDGSMLEVVLPYYPEDKTVLANVIVIGNDWSSDGRACAKDKAKIKAVKKACHTSTEPSWFYLSDNTLCEYAQFLKRSMTDFMPGRMYAPINIPST